MAEGEYYDLIYIDSYGDAGFSFDVLVNGYVIEHFETMSGSNFAFTFQASEPQPKDLELYSIKSPYVNDTEGSKVIDGVIFNRGTETVSSFDINYQIDGGSIFTHSLTGLSIDNFTSYHYEHTDSWDATTGFHEIKAWVSNVNGSDDQNNQNDTLYKELEIGTEIPNIIDQFLPNYYSIQEVGSSSDMLNLPTDLDFHPAYSKNELWVINKRNENSGGSTTIYSNPGENNQSSQLVVDGNAWHFMSLPTGIAFSKNGNFATSPGVYDANHQQSGSPFTGPSLWSSDLSVYGQPSGGNGSHLDMLHASPYSQGIASEEDNVFWVVDGYNNDLVRYDFAEDHGPGNSFHGDAIVHRYKDFSISKDPNNKVPSHITISDGWAYIVDYGNQRVMKIELNTGSLSSTPSFGPFESIEEYKYVTGYNYEEIVNSGLIEPCGIEVIDDRMLVSDYATGEIIIYDISSFPVSEIGRINTGAEGIMGIAIGPNGNIWYVDYDSNTLNQVYVDLQASMSSDLENIKLQIAPNPATNNFTITNYGNETGILTIHDLTGKMVYENKQVSNSAIIDCSEWSKGIYGITFKTDHSLVYEKMIVQ